jgi:hypothetical protein
MTSWHSYPQIFNMGHRYIVDLLKSDVLVEEKVDGSQFSFGMIPATEKSAGEVINGCVLRVRSKGAEMHPDAPEKMFAKGVEWIRNNAERLTPGWTYRSEYLAKPKHNALTYDRIPANHIILFDINPGEEDYLSWEVKAQEAERLGLETVPRLFHGRVESIEQFREYLTRESILGGQKIEGVVVKNYALFGQDKKVLMGKFVSEAFKEVHGREWKASNPTKTDVVQFLIARFHGPARWQKAIIHLREQGKITDTPKDIGALMQEVWPDIKKEAEAEIKDVLFKWAEDQMRRGVTAGLAEWYKEELLKAQFETPSIDRSDPNSSLGGGN